ncbi:hypothetical protein [Streptomyces althioticus]|uniref:hypothetical protein n=1 Tax=Streptomyces althioticus TaxID=83380 RepID=UPI0033F361D3
MNRKAVHAAIAVVLLGLASVACSSSEPAKTEPSPSPTVNTSSDKVTREQGATQYLKLVAPFNEALGSCVSEMNPLLEAGSTTPSDFPKLREACKDIPEANRTFANELEKATWPAEAQESISQMVDELRADQLAWQEVSEVRTHEELFDPKYPLKEDSGTADLVRARLGLPPVEEIG